MAAHLSDLTYKSHLLRLSEAYTEYKPPKEMDYKNFQFPIMPAPSPAAELYGVKGLTRLSPRSQERENRERQQGWNSRFAADFKGLHTIQNKSRLKDARGGKIEKPGERGRSESPSFGSSIELKAGSTSQSSAKSPLASGKNGGQKDCRGESASPGKKKRTSSLKNDQSGGNNKSSGSGNGSRSNRGYSGKSVNNHLSGERTMKRNVCLDEEVGMEDLIMKGNYRFHSDEDKEIYGRFVDMLTAYDPYEMVKILEDAMKDAQDSSLLDEYGGF